MSESKPIPPEELVDLQAVKKKSFVEKHPGLSDEQVETKKRELRESEEKLSKDQMQVENDLLEFLQKSHAIIVDDKAVAWVKDVPWFKILEMIPDDVIDQADGAKKEATDPKDVASVIKQFKLGKQTDVIFKMMEELITIPKKDWQWWRTNSTQSFIQAFNDHLEKRVSEISSDVSFF